MAKLYISGFNGIAGPIQAAYGLTESHELTIGASSVQSPVTENGTNLVRLLAEADCNVAISGDPNAETDNVIAMKAGIVESYGITPGDKIAVVQRSA